MKKLLTKQYMTVYVSSIIMIIFIWLLLSLFFVFGGKDANENEPQYLVSSFEQYVIDNQDIRISEEGKKY